jgi:hypothetical protein
MDMLAIPLWGQLSFLGPQHLLHHAHRYGYARAVQ